MSTVRWIYQTEGDAEVALLKGGHNALMMSAAVPRYFNPSTRIVISKESYDALVLEDVDVSDFMSVKDKVYNVRTKGWMDSSDVTLEVLAQGETPLLGFNTGHRINLDNGYTWRWDTPKKVMTDGPYKDMYAFEDPTGKVDEAYLDGVTAPHAVADVSTEDEAETE